MTPDTVNQRKRPRWFSQRGPVFWIVAPAFVIAATFAVLMFWPGLTYDWRSSGGQFQLVRYQVSADADVPGLRGDTFMLFAKGCELEKHWDPDRNLAEGRYLLLHSEWFSRSSGRIILRLGDHVFVFSWPSL
jgi:hypothetical protein